jgi:hypothetical protein
MVYFNYNNIITTLFLGYEWNSYAFSRKGLRVSNPSKGGAQRTTYFLQLPYRFAIPLLTVFGILHWLCSQSIYLVSLNFQTLKNYNYTTNSWSPFIPLTNAQLNGTQPIADFRPEPLEYLTCAFTPKAILFAVVIAFVLIAALVLIGLQKLPNGIPVAGTCSAAISAACHIPEGENGKEAALLPVQWGVVSLSGEDHNAVGHCSFSSLPVEKPVEGEPYAGNL